MSFILFHFLRMGDSGSCLWDDEKNLIERNGMRDAEEKLHQCKENSMRRQYGIGSLE